MILILILFLGLLQGPELHAVFRHQSDLTKIRDLGFPAESVVPLYRTLKLDPPLRFEDGFELKEVEEAACTGTFVTETVLLTSAHCLDPEVVNGAVSIYGVPAIGKDVPKEFDLNTNLNGHWSDVAVLYFPRELSRSLKITRFPKMGELRLAPNESSASVYYLGYGTKITNEQIIELSLEEKPSQEQLKILDEYDGGHGRLAFGVDKIKPYELIKGMWASFSLVPITVPPREEGSSIALDGDSGGPVLNVRGELVAILEGGNWHKDENKPVFGETTMVSLSHRPIRDLVEKALRTKPRNTKISASQGWLLGGLFQSGKDLLWVIPFHGSGRLQALELLNEKMDGKFVRDHFSKCDPNKLKRVVCSEDEGERTIEVTSPEKFLFTNGKDSRTFTRSQSVY